MGAEGVATWHSPLCLCQARPQLRYKWGVRDKTQQSEYWDKCLRPGGETPVTETVMDTFEGETDTVGVPGHQLAQGGQMAAVEQALVMDMDPA